MSEDNKPVVDANPAPQPTPSDPEAIRQRIVEEVQHQKTGDVMKNIMEGTPDAQPVAPGGTPDVAPQTSASDNNADAGLVALQLIETSTGRKFENVEEAQKFLQNLNSLVGDQSVAKAREAQKALDSLTQKFGKTPAEIEVALTNFVIEATKSKAEPVIKPNVENNPAPAIGKELDERLAELEDFRQLTALKDKYPAAVEVKDEIAAVAKARGISWVEAFESSPLKTLVELKAKEAEKNSPVVTPSTRTNVNYKRAQELGQRAFTGRATDDEKVELTKIVLGL